MYLIKTITAIAILCFAALIHAEVNINAATVQQLTELNNIGDVKAAAIVEYRTKHGYFQNVDDLLNVEGIGTAILEINRDMLTVDSKLLQTLPIGKTISVDKHVPTEMHPTERKHVPAEMLVPISEQVKIDEDN